MATRQTKEKTFRIIDTGDESQPYGLVDESTDIIVRTDFDPRKLSAYAFDMLGADRVRHDEDLVKAEVIPWTR